jgi:hypothetical protein
MMDPETTAAGAHASALRNTPNISIGTRLHWALAASSAIRHQRGAASNEVYIQVALVNRRGYR